MTIPSVSVIGGTTHIKAERSNTALAIGRSKLVIDGIQNAAVGLFKRG